MRSDDIGVGHMATTTKDIKEMVRLRYGSFAETGGHEGEEC